MHERKGCWKKAVSDALTVSNFGCVLIRRQYMPLEGNNIDEALLPDGSPRIKSGVRPKDGGGASGGPSGGEQQAKYNISAEAV
jgi:hypothetical protein